MAASPNVTRLSPTGQVLTMQPEAVPAGQVNLGPRLSEIRSSTPLSTSYKPVPMPTNLQLCTDPECHVDLTPQCADHCVVIACNDPTHNRSACLFDMHCDLACEGTVECVECQALDDFTECCNIQKEQDETSKPVLEGLFWDPKFEAFYCSCEEAVQEVPSASASSSSTPSILADTTTVSQSITQPQPFIPPLWTNRRRSTTFNFQPELGPHKCEWGSCNSTFASIEELGQHVNVEHLHLPAFTPPVSTEPNDAAALACLWKDCNDYHVPESIPGPSDMSHTDLVTYFLSNHLLHDHLGLSNPLPTAPHPELLSQFVPNNYGFSVPPPENHLQPHFEVNVSTADLLSLHGTSAPDITLPDSAGMITPPPSDVSVAASPASKSMDLSESDIHVCHWDNCGRSFTSCDDLTSHLNAEHVGSGKAHYDCHWTDCNRHGTQGFSSKQKLCRHLQSHTGHRPFQCKLCSQHFSEAATLQQHMRRHTQDKPYICDFPGCGKSFAITGALTIHKRTHSGEKPFKCTFCDRGFAESSNLSKHLRTHTGARPYPCGFADCGKSFARPDQLTRHMKVHNKVKKDDAM